MPPNLKECLHFQKVTHIWKSLLWTPNHLMARNTIKSKGKHTQLLCLSPFSWENHNSKGFSRLLCLLSHCQPCKPSGRWSIAARQCRPHYGFHVSLLSSGPKRHSSKLQLTGRFPSERVSDEKHLQLQSQNILWKFFFPLDFPGFLLQSLK